MSRKTFRILLIVLSILVTPLSVSAQMAEDVQSAFTYTAPGSGNNQHSLTTNRPKMLPGGLEIRYALSQLENGMGAIGIELHGPAQGNRLMAAADLREMTDITIETDNNETLSGLAVVNRIALGNSVTVVIQCRFPQMKSQAYADMGFTAEQMDKYVKRLLGQNNIRAITLLGARLDLTGANTASMFSQMDAAFPNFVARRGAAPVAPVAPAAPVATAPVAPVAPAAPAVPAPAPVAAAPVAPAVPSVPTVPSVPAIAAPASAPSVPGVSAEPAAAALPAVVEPPKLVVTKLQVSGTTRAVEHVPNTEYGYLQEALGKWKECQTGALIAGGGLLINRDNGCAFAGKIKQTLADDLTMIHNSGNELREVVLTEKNRYAIMFGYNGFTGNGHTAEFFKQMKAYYEAETHVRHITFNDLEKWIIVCDDTYSCSDAETRKFLDAGAAAYGLLRYAFMTDKALLAIYERGIFYRDIPEGLAKALAADLPFCPAVVKFNDAGSYLITDGVSKFVFEP